MSTADLVRFSKAEIPRQQAYVQPEEGWTAGLRAAEATREGWDSTVGIWDECSGNSMTGLDSCCVESLHGAG
jgi:hypothetical protein